ncbi:hypothetical protein AXF42_Ash004679 [Apostasia shenzhenica]|uniref:Transcription repressor n=1 Tax=Apostasia shenzhenica TaxID=1088818 RepID=A0A2I0BHA5_9ASPA|nr:hypothetical protein AXF42_Ash004679 [Apostasia shenzhenica]
MEQKFRLKDRLSRIFRTPSLILRSSAANSAATTTGAASNRSFSAAASDIAHEPVFVPHHRANQADELHHALLWRSLSLDRRPSRRFVISGGCGGCRPSAPPPMKKEKVEVGGGGRGCQPVSTASVSESYCRHYHCFKEQENHKKKKEERFGFFSSVERVGENRDRREIDDSRVGRTSSTFSASSVSENSYRHYHCLEKQDKRRKKTKKNKTKKIRNRNLMSLSSDDDEECGFFSSEERDHKEEEETETFFSSRSFSSDSSEFYRRPSPKPKGQKKNAKKKKSSCRPQPRREMRRKRDWANGYHPLVSVSSSKEVEEEMEEDEKSFAVWKKTSDPYSDFRSSMVEMIIEKQIFGARDLERLLRSYLSLNSPANHPVILRAFADISESASFTSISFLDPSLFPIVLFHSCTKLLNLKAEIGNASLQTN